VVVAGVAGLPDTAVDHPQRRGELAEDGLCLLGGGAVEQPWEELGGTTDTGPAALVMLERLPFGLGERPLHQRQRVAFFVGKVA
jgi:hypothetical protein